MENKSNASKYLLPVIIIWTVAGCLMPNICLSITEDLSLVQRITNIVLPAGIYWLLMSLTRNTGKAGLWMVIFEFFAAFQVVLIYIYGRSVLAVDMLLNVMTTNYGEATELLGSMMPAIILVLVVFLPPLISSGVAVARGMRLPKKVLGYNRLGSLVTICIGLVCYMASFFSGRPFHPVADIYPLNVGYNIYLAVERTILTSHFKENTASYSFGAVPTHPEGLSELYVIVIGETSRAENWQLAGYDRRTNMPLASDSALVFFKRAISQSNTTHKSVPMLLSPVEASTFNDSIYSTRGILSAFREAGFSTAFISNQRRNHSFIDFMGEEADTVMFLKDHLDTAEAEAHFDEKTLGPLMSILDANPRKQLVVIHSYGSHFAYDDRYPETTAMYLPDSPLKVDRSCKEELVNAYDNSIAYTSDFLAGIINILKTRKGISALMYTSDHGEDLFDGDRDLFLHASPVPSYYQLHVPFLVWTSEGYDDALPGRITALRQNREKPVATSVSFFHTALDIAGIRWPGHDTKRSVASFDYTPSAMFYLTDHNEAVPLEACGLKEYDFAKFNQLGIEL